MDMRVLRLRFSIVRMYAESRGILHHVHIAFPIINLSLTMRNLSRFPKRADYRIQRPAFQITLSFQTPLSPPSPVMRILLHMLNICYIK